MSKNGALPFRIWSSLIVSLVIATGCTEPKETTGVGAAAGGAIGAGLGAIIGSQTGDAGGGLAIGALAGSASGALVGNALQAQQEAVRSQDEAIERQERMIRAQHGEINELRRLNSDEVSKNQAALRNRGPNPIGSSKIASNSFGSTNTATEPRARLGTPSGIAERDITANAQPSHERRTFPEEVTQTEPPVVARAVKDSTNSESCNEAAREAQSASTASEQSDKLFHLRRALRLCPQSPQYHHELGKVYLGLNRKSDAEYEFKQALASDAAFHPAQESLDALNKKNRERF